MELAGYVKTKRRWFVNIGAVRRRRGLGFVALLVDVFASFIVGLTAVASAIFLKIDRLLPYSARGFGLVAGKIVATICISHGCSVCAVCSVHRTSE